MKVTVFSARSYDQRFLQAANTAARHHMRYVDVRLTAETAVLAGDADAVCGFVNDAFDRAALVRLQAGGIRLIALRSAGFNNVDLAAARDLNLTVACVPGYSPHAIAEHTIALILTLDRKTHRAYARVRDGNFALDGLLGFNLHGRTVGIVGTGQIGLAVARILHGFGCRLLGCDPVPAPAFELLGGQYTTINDLWRASDIISLHCPLTPATFHLVDAKAVAAMRRGAMLINTSRGAVVDTRAVIAGLKRGSIGNLGLDVYEEEADLFFEDLSDKMIGDDVFARLLTFPNVLITGHQAFFTEEALTTIAEATIANISAFEDTGRPCHSVYLERME